MGMFIPERVARRALERCVPGPGGCRRGHPLLGYASGQIVCRPCELERGRKKYPKRNARRYPKSA